MSYNTHQFPPDSSITASPYSIRGLDQIQLEQLYSKHQLIRCIQEEFVNAGFPEELEACDIPVEFGLDLLVQMALHKRADVSTMVGILRRHFDDGVEQNPAQACADMILKACQQDVCDWNQQTRQLVVRFTLTDDIQARIDQFQYPLPMIEEPLPVTHNKQTGYFTIRRSVLLRNNHHDDDVCLDHLNRVNRQKLALNQDVVAFMQNSWKNLDRQKEDETRQEFEARKRAFQKYDETSRDVLDVLMLEGDGFWLTHAYDKRGRVYAQGYAVNYQGNDWQKSCIQFAKKERLNEE